MDNENLVKMANNIADFFGAEPDKETAIKAVRDHLRRFWEMRMRSAIIQHVKTGGTGLSEIAQLAVKRLAEEQEALAASGDG